MSKYIRDTIEAGGVDCENCNQWRGLYGNEYVEKCPHCGDEEFNIYIRDERRSNEQHPRI